MKLQIVLLGLLACLAAPAQTPVAKQNDRNAVANRVKQPASTAQQSVVGCVDEESGRYVVRDAQTSQILRLQSPGSDDDNYFARYVGHKAQVTGIKASDTLKVTHIDQVADMCGTGK